MVKMDGVLWPRKEVAGMKVLNKELFKKEVVVVYLIAENLKVYNLMPILKPHLLKMLNFKPVRNLPDSTVSKIYLNPDHISSWSDFTEEEKENLDTLDISEKDLHNEKILLTYDNYYADNILKAILPDDKEGVSSFTKVGHIVQVNLREHLNPYKKVIAEILFEKIPGCESVVNKLNSINNTYRFFEMEVLKGSTNMQTTTSESHCKFEMDFSKVYWNSRLSTEHFRLIRILRPRNVLFDVFAGIGPFSIPAAKHRVTVFANDLNPESYKWLNHNRTLNHIKDDAPLSTYNLDGREFIQTVVKEELPKFLGKSRIFVVMNLPSMATEFLDAFVGLLKDTELPETFHPISLFVYCFTKDATDFKEAAKQKVIQGFNAPHLDIASKIRDCFDVRTVSSYKEMVRVTVGLDKEILVGVAGVGGTVQKRSHEDVDSDVKNNGQEQQDVQKRPRVQSYVVSK